MFTAVLVCSSFKIRSILQKSSSNISLNFSCCKMPIISWYLPVEISFSWTRFPVPFPLRLECWTILVPTIVCHFHFWVFNFSHLFSVPVVFLGSIGWYSKILSYRSIIGKLDLQPKFRKCFAWMYRNVHNMHKYIYTQQMYTYTVYINGWFQNFLGCKSILENKHFQELHVLNI